MVVVHNPQKNPIMGMYFTGVSVDNRVFSFSIPRRSGTAWLADRKYHPTGGEDPDIPCCPLHRSRLTNKQTMVYYKNGSDLTKIYHRYSMQERIAQLSKLGTI